MFKKKKPKQPQIEYNPDTMIPVLKCSICFGEKVFGFKEIETGRFIDVSLIRDDKELKEYMDLYGITDITKVY